MSLWKSLFGKSDRTNDSAVATAPAASAPPAPADPFASLTWIEADVNPAGLRCLDCRAVAARPVSPDAHAEQAARFAVLRGDDDRSIATLRPEGAVAIPAALRMPVGTTETRDGPLFVSKALEDKWDVFLYGGWMLFRRSWSGQLIYRTSLHTEADAAHIDVVEAPGEAATSDPDFCVREVDFLVKSLLYNLAVPHPLPQEMQADDRALAEFSYQRHGRRGLWATYGDTLAFDPWKSKG